jgi:succinoglycan biosynthesis protein ExoA
MGPPDYRENTYGLSFETMATSLGNETVKRARRNADSVGMKPRVSVVIPALDEAAHIERCVGSVLAQDLNGGLEVIVVDGGSTDGTADLARRAGARVVENPDRVIPTALNRGLAAARGDVLVRFDAHAEMPPGYVAACVRALAEEPNAANVGGWREARGTGPWARATGAVLASRFGVGNPKIWRRPRDGERRDVEHVPLGCFRTSVLRDAGGWREQVLTNEDFELNHRLRSGGGRVVFDPAIWSVYHPRESPGALARQYWRYGNWKAVVLADAPRSLRPRQLAPAALLALVALAAVPTPARGAARAAVAAYPLALAVVARHANAGWRGVPVLATIHLAWGLGLVRGLGREGVRRAAVHARRAERRPGRA